MAVYLYCKLHIGFMVLVCWLYGGMRQPSSREGIVANCLELCLSASSNLWSSPALSGLCQYLQLSCLHLAPSTKSGCQPSPMYVYYLGLYFGSPTVLGGLNFFRDWGSGPANPWQKFYLSDTYLYFPESLSQVGQDQEGGSVMVTPQFTPITVS